MSRNNSVSVLLGLVIGLLTPLVAQAQQEVRVEDRSDWTTQNILRLGGSLNNFDPGLNFNGTDWFRDENDKRHTEQPQKAGTIDMKMVRTYTRSEFDRTVSGKVSGKCTNGLLDIKGGAANREQVRFDRTSLTVAFVATVTFKRTDAGVLNLSPNAIKEVDKVKNSPRAGEKIVNLFGTHVLSGITREGRIILVQNYTFSSEMKCREASAQLEASYGPTSMAAEVKTAMKKLDEKSTLDVYYYQDCVNLTAVDLGDLFSPLNREQQLKGLAKCLGAFDSTGCPIKIRWLTSLRDVPKIKSMMQDGELPGLEVALQKHEKLASERSQVAQWFEEAVVTRDVLERVRLVRVHDLKVDPGTRAADFAKAVAAVQDWLKKPEGKTPELPSTKITKADVEGAILRNCGWAFGQRHQNQNNKGSNFKVVADFRVAPIVEVLMIDIVSKDANIQIVNEDNPKDTLVLKWSELVKFHSLAELTSRNGNQAKPVDLHDQYLPIGATPGNVYFELIRFNQTHPSSFKNSTEDSWVHFIDNVLPQKSNYVMQFTDKWGQEHTISLGNALKAPGLTDAEKLYGPGGRTRVKK